MALFSRRDKRSDPVPPDASDDALIEPAAIDHQSPQDSDATPAATGDESVSVDMVPDVPIAVSTYRGAASAPAPDPPPPSEPIAVPQTETVAGMRDNVLLRDALATLGAEPSPVETLGVARQLLQGHVYLRAKGDARTLLGEGKPLPLAVQRRGDDTYALVFSSGRALQESVRLDGDRDTSAVAQPVLVMMSQVLAGTHAGIVIDPASAPASIALPRQLLEQMLAAADPRLAVKTLLAGERTDETPAQLAEALVEAKLYVAVNSTGKDEGGERFGLAEARSADGTRMLEIYTHPLEVVAMGREDRGLPFSLEQLARALRSDRGISGIVLDPAGPWIALTRDQLGPLLALAD